MVLKMPEMVATFEEYSMRINVIKSNHFITNFYDKAVDLEKIITIVGEFMNEWHLF